MVAVNPGSLDQGAAEDETGKQETEQRNLPPPPPASLFLNFIKVVVKKGKKSPWQHLIASLRNRGKETWGRE